MTKKRNAIIGLLMFFVFSVSAGMYSVFAETEADGMAGETDEAVVYDLYDIADTYGPASYYGDWDDETRIIGTFEDTHNIAFRTKISPDPNRDHVYIGFEFLNRNTDGYVNGYGYGLEFDWSIALYYNTDPTRGTQNGYKTKAAEVALPSAVADKEDFILEFGCVKYYENEEWAGNYVYVKINDEEVLSWTDQTEFYEEKGTNLVVDSVIGQYMEPVRFTSLKFEEAQEIAAETIAAIEALPAPEEVTLDDRAAIEGARAMYDSLNESVHAAVSNYDKLIACEEAYLSLVSRKDEAVVYDLYDISGEFGPHIYNSANGRQIGSLPDTVNVAFQAKITPQANRDHVYFDLGILQKTTTGYVNEYGYFLLIDWDIRILYDTNPIVSGEGDATAAAVLGYADMPEFLRTPGMYRDFVLEFGSVKYYEYDEWVGNYVYVKIDGEEILSFIDKSEYFQDKGNRVLVGETAGWTMQYPFSTTYEVYTITYNGTSPAVRLDPIYYVIDGKDAEITMLTEVGYQVSDVFLNGVSVKDDLVSTPGGYILTVSGLTENAELTLATEQIAYAVTVETAEGARITAPETVPALGSLQVEILPEQGMVLKSFSINGLDCLPDVVLEATGYSYRLDNVQENVTVSAQFEEKSFSVSVTVSGEGSCEYVPTVSAWAPFEIRFVPAEGMLISGIKLNGEAIATDENGVYSIAAVNGDLQFQAEFISAGEEPPQADGGCKGEIVSSALYGLFAFGAAAAILFIMRKAKKHD